MEFINYIIENSDQIISLTIEHIYLTGIAVLLALIIGVPLGIFISYYKGASKFVVGLANLFQAIPSMALLGLAIPLLGIGSLPSIVVVILYSLLPIIKNTYTGISSIDSETIEAANAIGLTKFQILVKVQIPLALSVIMAGVRISAVTAVGLMTMAAFIGAGGLGYLIFSGISSVNTIQIMAGAIPSAILALLVDYVFGMIEEIVVPKTKSEISEDKKKRKKRQQYIIIILLVVVLLFAGINSFRTGAGGKTEINVGGKNFTEQYLLTHLVSEMIEDRTDLKVNRNAGLGGTHVAFEAIRNGKIDLYIDYTGTIHGDILGYEPSNDMEEVFMLSKDGLKDKYDLEVLNQFNFNNTYVMAVTEETAEKYDLKTISDLKDASPEMKGGMTIEFLNRDDGLKGLIKYYGLDFKSTQGVDGSNRYIALTSGDVDVTDAFSTDGLLKKFQLVTLEDDKSFFPPYRPVPVVRTEILEEHPEIIPVLEELGGILDSETMIELNYRIDELQERPEEVAKSFLKEQGLID